MFAFIYDLKMFEGMNISQGSFMFLVGKTQFILVIFVCIFFVVIVEASWNLMQIEFVPYVTDYFTYLIKEGQDHVQANFIAVKKMKADWATPSSMGYRNTVKESRRNTVHMLDQLEFNENGSKVHSTSNRGRSHAPSLRISVNDSNRDNGIPVEDYPTNAGVGTFKFPDPVTQQSEQFVEKFVEKPGKSVFAHGVGNSDNNTASQTQGGVSKNLSNVDGFISQENRKVYLKGEMSKSNASGGQEILKSNPDYFNATGSSMIGGPNQSEYLPQKILIDEEGLEEPTFRGQLNTVRVNNLHGKSIIEMVTGENDRDLSKSGDVSKILDPIEVRIVGKERGDGNEGKYQDELDGIWDEKVPGNFTNFEMKSLVKKDIVDDKDNSWEDLG